MQSAEGCRVGWWVEVHNNAPPRIFFLQKTKPLLSTQGNETAKKFSPKNKPLLSTQGNETAKKFSPKKLSLYSVPKVMKQQTTELTL